MTKKSMSPGSLHAILALALLLPMCSKGPTGATGPQGPQGLQGDKGTANVIYSAWTGGFSGVSATWPVAAITQGVLDSAAVLVYVKQGTYVFQLPYDNINGSGFYINDLVDVGNIYLFCDGGDNLNEFSFRWMIIPGGVATSEVNRGYGYVAGKFGITP